VTSFALAISGSVLETGIDKIHQKIYFGFAIGEQMG
jgi:hypothetical protein